MNDFHTTGCTLVVIFTSNTAYPPNIMLGACASPNNTTDVFRLVITTSSYTWHVASVFLSSAVCWVCSMHPTVVVMVVAFLLHGENYACFFFPFVSFSWVLGRWYICFSDQSCPWERTILSSQSNTYGVTIIIIHDKWIFGIDFERFSTNGSLFYKLQVAPKQNTLASCFACFVVAVVVVLVVEDAIIIDVPVRVLVFLSFSF